MVNSAISSRTAPGRLSNSEDAAAKKHRPEIRFFPRTRANAPALLRGVADPADSSRLAAPPSPGKFAWQFRRSPAEVVLSNRSGRRFRSCSSLVQRRGGRWKGLPALLQMRCQLRPARSRDGSQWLDRCGKRVAGFIERPFYIARSFYLSKLLCCHICTAVETAGLVVRHPRTRNGSCTQIVSIGAKIDE